MGTSASMLSVLISSAVFAVLFDSSDQRSMSRSPTPFAPLTAPYACVAERKIVASRPGAVLAIAAAMLSGTLVVSIRTATAKAPAPVTALVEGR